MDAALPGTALALIIDVVETGSNQTFKSFLDLINPIVSINAIGMGVKLLFLGPLVLGEGISYINSYI